jgi:hypothetical protein
MAKYADDYDGNTSPTRIRRDMAYIRLCLRQVDEAMRGGDWADAEETMNDVSALTTELYNEFQIRRINEGAAQ